jgi:3-phosphoshikimate 1-carboxyvinyltransferase
MIQRISPAKKLRGTIQLPPDKSIAHRSGMFAALSDGKSVIHNYSDAADPQSTLSCLRQLGVDVKTDGNTVTIQGVGRDGFQTPAEPLDCGNSGTTMRLMSGILSGAGIECTMIGDASLSSRTMKRVIDPIRSMGGVISGRDGAYAPLKIEKNSGIKGIRFPLPIASAQLKSCVLLAGLFGEDPTEVIETLPSRDHTERLLELPSEAYGQGKIIKSGRFHKIPPQNYTVPGDFSAAAFWLVAASVHPDADIMLNHAGINPSRIALLSVLEEMGAEITLSNHRMEGAEPVADIRIVSSGLKSVHPNPALIPNCIDELPVLMIAMSFAEGVSRITGASELRHKETDRLAAMGAVLKAAGVDFTLTEEGVEIKGSPRFTPDAAEYKSEHDHRIAMSAAVMSLMADGESSIVDAECTAISYPGFWSDASALTGK